MTDPVNTGGPGSASTGASAGGIPSSETAGQSAVNPGLTLEAIASLIDTKIAPVLDEVRRSKNAQAAANRIGQKGARTPETVSVNPAGAPDTPNLIVLADRIPDPAVKEAVIQLARESEARAERDRAAAEQAKRDRDSNELKRLLDVANPARRGLLERLLVPHVKEGMDGQIIYDDGRDIRPLDEVVREHLADDAFKPASGSQGTGTVPGIAPTIGQANRNIFAGTEKILDPVERLTIQNERARSTRGIGA